MTIGSYSLDSFQPNPHDGSWIGRKGAVSWSGEDSPKSPRPTPTFFYIYREVNVGGKLVVRRYRIRQKGWTQKRAKKGLHAFSKHVLHLEQRPFVLRNDGRVFADMAWLSPGSWGAAALLDANDQIKLVGKLSEKIKGSDFNMSVFLGEGRQTLKLLGDTAIRIAKSVHHARQLDVLGTARSLFEGTSRAPLKRHDWRIKRPVVPTAKNAASLWLELQYGWLPLLKDAEGMAQSLAHALNVPFQQTYKVGVRKELAYLVGGPLNTDNSIVGKVVKSHKRGLIAKITEPPSVLAQLGLLDPELVAWELVPFSFVADWFIPIGSWMESRALAGRLVGTFLTSDKREAYVLDVKPNDIASGGFYHEMFFDRVISSSLSVPMPTIKPLSKVASWQHCANAVALVTGLFSTTRTRASA